MKKAPSSRASLNYTVRTPSQERHGPVEQDLLLPEHHQAVVLPAVQASQRQAVGAGHDLGL